MSDQNKSARSIFTEAVESVPQAEWSEFLDQECGDDLALREQVQRLLEAHEDVGSFMDRPAAGVSPTIDQPITDQPITDKPGTQIGSYKLLQHIGEGGMGTVFMAEQREPVKRRVAVKIVKPGMDSQQVLARFEAERQALAMMDHPNIARALDVGTTDTGRPYFVMELVKGMPITRYCDNNHLTPRERLELFVPICHAVQHAHQKGIIHRDIKPSNVLVTEYDGRAVPKIIDFGVAKALHQQLTEKTMFTQLGQVVGTLEYMSPEQAGVNQQDVDTRSDIYTLGVLLYELLTGSTPFDKKRLRSAAWDELLRIIREEEPLRPSMKLSTSETLPSIAANRRTEPAKLRTLVRRELDWIVMKALDKDRNRRYATANGLGADVQRYLDDEQVLACPPSAAYRFRKFARHNRAALVTASAVAAAVLMGMLGTTWQAIRASDSNRQAQTERDLANQERDRAVDAEKLAETRREEAEAARDATQRALRRSEAHRLAARSALTLDDNPGLALALAVEGAQRLQSPVTNRSVLEALDANHEHRTLIGHNATILAASFSPDGTRVLTAQSARGNMPARIWDVVSGKQLLALKGDNPIQWAIFSPDGKHVLANEMRSMVSLWDAETGKQKNAFRGDAQGMTPAAFSSDAAKLLLPVGDTVKVIDVTTGKELLALSGHKGSVVSATFSPDGPRVVTHAQDQTVRIWDAATGRELVKLDWLVGRMQSGVRSSTGRPVLEQIKSATFTRDGRRILTTSSDNTGRMWDAETGEEIRAFPYLGAYGSVRLSPDGERVMAHGSGDQFAFVEIRDVNSGKEILKLKGHTRGITSAAYSPDGRRVVTTSYDETVRIWDADRGTQLAVLKGHEGRVNTASFSPDGRFVVSGSDDATARIWNVENGNQRTSLPVPESSSPVVAVSQDGTRLAALGPMRLVTKVWNVRTGRSVTLPTRAIGGTISPDGSRVLTRSGGIFATDTGEPLAPLRGDTGRVGATRFSHDGKYVVTDSADHSVRIWETATGAELAKLTGHTDRVTDVAFARDGKRVISASADGSARIWQWESDEAPLVLTGHGGQVTSCAISDDGLFAVTVGRDHAARIWQVSDGKEVATLKDPIGISAAAISPDAKRVLTYQSFTNSVVRVWSLPTGEQSFELDLHGPAKVARFSPDGGRLFTAAEGDTPRICDAATGEQLVELKEAADISYADFSPDGKQIAGTVGFFLRLWDAETGEPVKTLAAHSGAFRDLHFGPSGNHVVAGFLQDSATIWDLTTRQRLVELQSGHGWQIWHMAFSLDGTKLATASFDTTARLWDAATGKELAVLSGHTGRLHFATFSPDGKRLATTADDATARIWSVETGKLLHTLGGHTGEVSFASFDAEGKRLLTACDDSTARVWDVATGEELLRMKHGSAISAAQFSRDGRRILTASSGWVPMTEMIDGRPLTRGSRRVEEHTARVWDAQTGKQLLVLEHDSGVRSATFSPSGNEIVTAAETVQIWDAATGKKRSTMQGYKGRISRITFSPDGSQVLTTVFGGDAYVWDALTGERLFALAIDGESYRVAFTPDARQIMSVSRKGAIRFFPVDPLGAAISRIPRKLTAKERALFETTHRTED